MTIAKMLETATPEQIGTTRTQYNFNKPTKLGGKLSIDVTLCEPNKSKSSLPNLWKKHGYMDRVLENYYVVEVFAYDDQGQCFHRFNPQLMPDHRRINFDWMAEATPDNLGKLLLEILRLAYGEEETC